MDAPTGLDLNPRPPQTVRLGKRAGLCFLIALGLVLAMLVYGIYFRRANQGRQIWRDEQARVGPATAAARAVEASAADVPNLAAVPNRAPTGDPAPAAAPPLQNGSPAPVAQPRQPTAAELRLAALYEREQQAIAAPTGVRASETGFSDPAMSAPGEAPDAAYARRARAGIGRVEGYCPCRSRFGISVRRLRCAEHAGGEGGLPGQAPRRSSRRLPQVHPHSVAVPV